MKTSTFLALAAAKLVAGHTTFQSFVIGGKDQGQHFAVQTPSNGNNPILDVTSTAMVCNGGKPTADQVEVASGSEITFQWHHNDPATTSGDSDEPIAASHKGPVMVYIAPAASKGEGAVWQKIFEEGLTGGKWAVEKFISNKGQITIKLPDLAAGDYIIRPEIIALHEASAVGKAQFYNGCGQIKVTGSGSVTLPASGTDMTKAYSATDKGVQFDIYSGATSYPIPGPKLFSAGSTGTTPSEPAASSAAPAPSAPATTAAPAPSASAPATQPKPTTLVTSARPAATGAPSTGSGAVAKWGQCGGKEYKGATSCSDNWVCKEQNPYYSQCVEKL